MMTPTRAHEQGKKRKKGLSDVVNGLRNEKGWSQAKLAEEAGLSQPALSRLLSKEGDPKLGHLWSLAQALGVSVLQLASDSGVEDVLSEVVPREHFIETDQKRVEAQREAGTLGSQLAARDAETARLRAAVEERGRELASAKGRIAQLQVVEAEVEGLRAEAALQQARADQLDAALASKVAELSEVTAKKIRAEARVQQMEALIKGMQSRAHQLERDLRAAKNTTAAVGVVAGFAALGAGAWLAGRSNGTDDEG